MFCCVCAYKCLKISLLGCTYYVVCGSRLFYLNLFCGKLHNCLFSMIVISQLAPYCLQI